MAKFNITSIRGMENIKEKEENIGEGLLSEVSKGGKEKRVEIDIPRNLIKKNPKNKYSIEGIKPLAESIRVRGVIQRLEVKAEDDGTYMLLGGERRITAVDMLIENPDVPEWTESSLVPCILTVVENINMKLSYEGKERYAILTTNAWNRKYNNADKVNEMEEWRSIVTELRENGVDSIVGYDEEGNEKEIKIKGEKTRDILTEVTGASRGTINNIEQVQSKGSKELIDAMMGNNIAISVAAQAVKELNEEEQKTLAKASVTEKITAKDIKKFRETNVGKNDKVITPQKFRKDIKGINNLIKNNEIILDENALQSYYSYIEKIEKLLGGHI